MAYQIRYAFDHIELLSQRIRRVDATISTFDDSSQTLCRLIIDVIHQAIASGSRIYNTGIKRNKDWMKSCTIIYLYTAQELLTLLETTPDHHITDVFKPIHMYLLLAVADNQTVTDENTYKVAWDIRDNFDHILSILE